MKADTVIENKRIGQVLTDYSNIQTALGAGRYGGIRLTINPNNLSYLQLYVSDILLAIDSANTNVPVLVFDMTTLKLVYSFTYGTGGIEQFIGKEFAAGRRKLDLAIVYEMDVNAPKFIPKKGSCYDCGGKVREAHICPFVDAIGIDLTTDGTNVLSAANQKYTSGMSLNYNVNCDRSAWLCSIGGLMAMPLAYATAVEIYNYALTVSPNQRVNTTVSLNKGFIKGCNGFTRRNVYTDIRKVFKYRRAKDTNTSSQVAGRKRGRLFSGLRKAKATAPEPFRAYGFSSK